MSSDNVSTLAFSTSTEYELERWKQDVFLFGTYWTGIASPISSLFNLIILFTLVRTKGVVPETVRIIMINQSVIELNQASWLILKQNAESTHTGAGAYNADDGGHMLCFLLTNVFWIFDAMAGFNNTLTTVERYVAIVHPLKKLLTIKRLRYIILFIDFVIGPYAGYTLYIELMISPSGQCLANTALAQELPCGTLWFTQEIAPILAVLFLYPPMLMKIRNSAKNLRATGGNALKQAASNRLNITLLLATIVLIVSSAPTMVLYSISEGFLQRQLLHPYSFQQSVQIQFKTLYPLCNPILYGFSSPKFRRAIIDSFRFKNPFKSRQILPIIRRPAN